MNSQIDAIVGQIDRFRTLAREEQASFHAFERNVKADPRRTQLAKSEDIAAARKESAERISAARQGEESFLQEERSRLMEVAFNPGSIITSSDRLSYRDATDRVTSLDKGDEEKAIAMYETATQVGDQPMIALLAKQAYTRGMPGLLETHLNKGGYTRESVQALQYIDQVEQSLSARFSFGLAYSVGSSADNIAG